MSSIDKLENIDVSSSSGLEDYCKELQSICKDLYLEVHYIADVVFELLSALPKEKSRQSAKLVSSSLVKIAENFKVNGSLSVKTWKTFMFRYQEELEAVKYKSKPKKTFKF